MKGENGFKDKYREQVEALIAGKIQDRETPAGLPHPAVAAPVADIMEVLQKSLEAARKPPNRAEEVSAESKSEHRVPKRQATRS
jgi:non-homologous end joining protein Ku